MTYFKSLGDGLLSAVTGVSRQAMHKARSKGKGKRTFDAALRYYMSRQPLLQNEDPLEWVCRTTKQFLLDRTLLLVSPELKLRHRVYDVPAAAKELATLLEVPFTEGMTLTDVVEAYTEQVIANAHEWLEANPQTDLGQWPFGVYQMHPNQLAARSRQMHAKQSTPTPVTAY